MGYRVEGGASCLRAQTGKTEIEIPSGSEFPAGLGMSHLESQFRFCVTKSNKSSTFFHLAG